VKNVSIYKQWRLVSIVVVGLALVGATTVNAQQYGSTTGPLQIGSSSLQSGVSVLVAGEGFAPGAPVTITLQSDPIVLDTTTADMAGRISDRVTIPVSAPAGDHHVVATGQAVDGGTLTLSAAVTVAASPATTLPNGKGSVPVPSGPIPTTGANWIATKIWIGIVVIVAGTVLIFGVRRRRRAGASN
jgi:hypothetical protein